LFKTAHVDPYLSLVVVLPLFFGVGALLYVLVIQRIVEAPHSAHMMVTLGLLLVFENLANLFFGGDLRGITTKYTTSSFVMGPVACSSASWRRSRASTSQRRSATRSCSPSSSPSCSIGRGASSARPKSDPPMKGRLAVGVVALGVAAAVPLVAGQHLLTAFIVALHAAYMALAWNVAAGYAGQFSLGHSLFYGIGAYASTMLYLKLGLTPWVGMFAGAALAGVVGVLLALGVYRYNVRGIFFALVTLGAAEVAKGLADNWDWIKGPVGILLTMKAAPAEFFFLRREPYYYVALAMVVAMVAISLVLERSRLGQHFLAVREDEAAAEASGVDTHRAKTVAIGLSAALTAFAGSFYAQFYLYVSPETVLTFEPQLTMMLGTMVGG